MSQLRIPFDQGRSGEGSPPTLTVGEAVRGADRCLGRQFAAIWVKGEISNLRLAGSGHAYFTLKDEQAALPTAMFRSALQRVRFRLEEGLSVRVLGRLGIYAGQGRFQLYADRAEVAGLGDRMLALEQLKRRLSGEGLFAAERKRPLPRWPRCVGVVTSADGAAIHDIVKVIKRRYPTPVLLSGAAVQGEAAPRELVAALARLSRVPAVDVIILGRGGGSLEDLWGFNDESLARAVAQCPVPVVSAVGHEVDITICDLVADARAATPSQAGELVVPDRSEVMLIITGLARRLRAAIERAATDERGRLDRLERRLERHGRRLVSRQRERLLAAEHNLSRHMRRGLDARRRKLEGLSQRLEREHPRARMVRDRRRLATSREHLFRCGHAAVADARLRLGRAAGKLDALSPLAVLARGYAVVTSADGAVVSSAAAVDLHDELELRLHRGRVHATVNATETE